MFDKLIFNNMIISNKKKLKQARAHTIQRLIHKLKKLQELKEKHPENGKMKEKIRKTTACIEFAKKVKPDEMVKQILVMTKSPTAVISNETATLEEIAYAMLAMNKSMQTLVDEMKAKFELDPDDNQWREAIMAKSKKRLKIERTEQKKKLRQQSKEQKLAIKNRQNWLEQNPPAAMEENDEDRQDQNDNGSTEDIIQIKEEKYTVDEPIDNFSKAKGNQSKKSLVKNNLNKQKPMQREKSAMKEKNHKEFFEAKAKVKKVASPKIEEKPVKVEKVVDPFFITDSGENYVATAIVKPEEPTTDGYEGRDPSLRKSFKNDRDSLGYKDSGHFKNSHQGRKRIREQEAVHQKPIEIDESLHPSWQAKLKQKPIIINNMNNKKIKFDDEGESKIVKSYKPETKTQPAQASDPAIDESFHPSWVAKQKLKPVIKEFQGKKITFDDD